VNIFGSHRKSGFSLVEILVSAAIIAVVGVGVTAAWRQYINLTQSSARITQAALLTEEAGEALEFYRDLTWSGYIAPLTLGTPYYLYWNGTGYATSTTEVAVQNNYSVSFVLASVMRDGNSNIVSSAGTGDPNTLKATITVAPLGNLASPYSQSELLIHNVYAN
jgi:prepilin-type N-terminal cleavage/methylation domain-containing protein